MKIGAMDRQITLQVASVEAQASGARRQTWATLATVWAKADFSGGGESYEAEQKTATGNVTFTIWHRTDVSESNRLTYNSGVYDILNVQETELGEGQISRQRFLTLKCEVKDGETAS